MMQVTWQRLETIEILDLSQVHGSLPRSMELTDICSARDFFCNAVVHSASCLER